MPEQLVGSYARRPRLRSAAKQGYRNASELARCSARLRTRVESRHGWPAEIAYVDCRGRGSNLHAPSIPHSRCFSTLGHFSRSFTPRIRARADLSLQSCDASCRRARPLPSHCDYCLSARSALESRLRASCSKSHGLYNMHDGCCI